MVNEAGGIFLSQAGETISKPNQKAFDLSLHEQIDKESSHATQGQEDTRRTKISEEKHLFPAFFKLVTSPIHCH
jgi:hypothetical protein